MKEIKNKIKINFIKKKSILLKRNLFFFKNLYIYIYFEINNNYFWVRVNN
jgi:hypothetical protein